MVRFVGNPILRPIKEHVWESRYVFNSAMVMLGGRFHFFYRAMGDDMVSRIGYASSKDGYHVDERLPYPVFEPENYYETKGCEDPRLTIIGDQCIMTYTAYDGDIFQIGISRIPIDFILKKKWEWGERIYPFPKQKNKNAVLFPNLFNGKYVMFHRLEPDICIAYSDNLRDWGNSKKVMSPRLGYWDCVKVGAAGPPIELDIGWLLVYHGVDKDRIYRLGAALFSKDKPHELLYRSEEPILEPNEEYEIFGLVPNVVFSCGSVLVNDNLICSYGGADTVVGIATFKLNEILNN